MSAYTAILRGLGTADVPDTGPRRGELRATLHGPDGSEPVLTELGSNVQRLLEERSDELGLDQSVTVSVTADETAPAVELDLAGMPVAVGLGGGRAVEDLLWAASVVTDLDRALRRRLSVLLSYDRALTIAESVVSAGTCPPEVVHEALIYCLDNGIRLDLHRLRREVAHFGPDASAYELGEALIERLAPDRAVVLASVKTARAATLAPDAGLASMRQRLFSRTGIQFPDFDFEFTDLPMGYARLRLQHVTLAPADLSPLVLWHILEHDIERDLHAHRSWFIRRSDVWDSIETVADAVPELASLVQRLYPPATVAACLRALVADDQPVQNLPRMLWLLLDVGSTTTSADVARLTERPLLCGPDDEHASPLTDPEALAAEVRQRITEEQWRLGIRSPVADPVRLPPDIEQTLLRPGPPMADANAIRAVLRRCTGVDGPVVTRTVAAVRPVRALLQALPRPPHVQWSNEIPLAIHVGD